MDRISGLPDEIIFHIFSFLSTKEAALTPLLSKRWLNLFALTPNLRLEEEDKDCVSRNPDLDTSRSFGDFVDRVLAVSDNSPVNKFSLKYRHNVESARINLWISNVLARGVLELLHVDVIAKGVTSLPSALFTCMTIFELKLGRGLKIDMVPKDASLPALKILFLDRIQFTNHGDRLFEALLYACQVLEELLICGNRREHWEWCRTVSCPTLQRLTIINKNSLKHFDVDGFLVLDFRSLTLDTPNLSYLDYDAHVPDEYPIVNLDSLLEAKLNLSLRFLLDKSNPTNFIKGLRNVKILNLSTTATCETFKSYGEAIPVLKNPSHLSIHTNFLYWKVLPLLLKRSPNLQTLAIKGPSDPSWHHNFNHRVRAFSFLSSCPVKVIEMTNFWGSVGEFSQMECLLEKLPCLELVEVSARAKDEKAKLQLATDMLTLPRVCKIQLEFFFMQD